MANKHIFHPCNYYRCHGSSGFTQHKKDPQQDQQVHHQENAVDPGYRGIGALRSYVAQPIAVLPLSELTLNWDALQILQLLFDTAAALLPGRPFLFRDRKVVLTGFYTIGPRLLRPVCLRIKLINDLLTEPPGFIEQTQVGGITDCLSDDLAGSLEKVLMTYIEESDLNIELAARLCNLSKRTLQRRLTENNTRYSEVLVRWSNSVFCSLVSRHKLYQAPLASRKHFVRHRPKASQLLI